MTIQLKATHSEQYFPDFPVLLLFMLYKVVLTFGSVMSAALSAVSVSPSGSLLPVYPVIFSVCVFSPLSYFIKVPVD